MLGSSLSPFTDHRIYLYSTLVLLTWIDLFCPCPQQLSQFLHVRRRLYSALSGVGTSVTPNHALGFRVLNALRFLTQKIFRQKYSTKIFDIITWPELSARTSDAFVHWIESTTINGRRPSLMKYRNPDSVFTPLLVSRNISGQRFCYLSDNVRLSF